MIELYLGTGAAGWAVDGRVQAWEAHTDIASALARWAAAIGAAHATRWRRAPATLWLSGGLARPLMAAPVHGVRGWAEAEALAAAAAPEATGLAGPCVVRLEGWPDAAPVLATAVDLALERAIAQAADAHRIAWRSVRPWWARALAQALHARPGARVLAVEEADALTLLGGLPAGPTADGTAFGYATTYAPAPDAAHATALWHRTLLSQDLLADDALFARAEPFSDAGDTPSAGWPRAAWGASEAGR